MLPLQANNGTRWWELFADAEGALMVEHHGGRWAFVPSRLGRPARIPKPGCENPLQLLPFDIERLQVVA